ncbi:MAG: WD40/YVTN/BNR-like repeat-containing protein [Candidatus Aminicenantaceae bacterium]
MVESNPHIIYVATASGGVWKTTNNGVTWKPIFDDQNTSTIGDITVAPSNPDIIWVGTGEPNNRQSSSWGNGVYKSTDGGNRLFKSRDRGETLEASIDLTTQQDRDKLPLMGVLSDKNTLSRNDGIAFYGDIITISESPLKEGLLSVGTDDGNLQVSQDGGKTWKNVISKVPGVPKYTYVSRIVTSHFHEGTAYATFDGHRNNDFKSYVFMTADYGETWKSISSNLPEGGTVNVIREHHRNPNLLFVGTEQGAYIKGSLGHKVFVAPNPPFGVIISYYLKEKVKENVKIVITDSEGKTIRELNGPKEAGIN